MTDRARAGDSRQAAVVRLGRLALDVPSVDELFDAAMVEIVQALDVSLCEVLELLPDGDALRLRAGVGWARGMVGNTVVPAGRCSQAGYTVHNAASVIVTDLSRESRFSVPPLVTEQGIVSGLSVVIGPPHAAWGVLGAHARARTHFTQVDLDFLESVANLLYQVIRRERSDATIAARDTQLRLLADSVPVLIARVDREQRYRFNNAAYERWLGVPRHQIEGKRVEEIIGTKAYAVAKPYIERALAGDAVDFEVDLPARDGGEFTALVSYVPDRTPPAVATSFYVVVVDITQQKQAERRLHKLTEELARGVESRAALLQLTGDVAAAANEARTVEDAVCYILRRVSEFNGWSYAHALAVDEDEPDRLAPMDCFYEDTPARFEELRALTRNTEIRRGIGLPGRVLATAREEWVEDPSQDLARCAPLARQLGITTAVAFPVLVGDRVAMVLEFFSSRPTTHDHRLNECMKSVCGQLARVIERTRASRERRTRDVLLRSIYSTVVDGIVAAAPSGEIRSVNPAVGRMFGYSPAALHGRSVAHLVPGLAAHEGGITACLESAVARDGWELEGRRKDGQRFPVHVSASEARVDDERAFSIVIRDFSLIVESRERALRAERLAAIGETVTGLAHESRNALQRSQACLSLLQLKLSEESEALELVKEIQEAQDNLHALYEEVRDYASPFTLNRERVSLGSIVARTWKALELDHGPKGITLRRVGKKSDLRCDVDARRFGQVVRNVLENAVHMSPVGAVIEIGYEDARLGDTSAACVVVRDHGPGLDDNQAERVFELFFTTRANGTGLGMPIARRIVEEHGGTISIRNAPKGGAEVRIVLPRRR